MIEKWTEFQGGPNGRNTERARVTLSKRSVVVMNRWAYEAFGSPAAVTLAYEEDRRVIGLRPSESGKANAFPVKQKDNWNVYRIYIMPLCKHYGLDIRRTVLFNEIDIDREGMMRLELNRTQMIGKG
jgi:hypothetical protein